MAIDYAKLMALQLPPTVYRYTERDTMLYALGIGFGADPVDPAELAFVYERALKVMPTLATVVAWNDRWLAGSGMNFVMVVHGEQRLAVHRPLPAAAEITAEARVVEAFDKGPGRGAVVLTETVLRDAATGDAYVTLGSTVFARGDGGFGGPSGAGPAPHSVPDRAPDAVCDIVTAPRAALIYRLSGDRNPLHADPDFAAVAGFPRPILHGLCSYGHVARAVLKTYCDFDPTLIRQFDARFSAPVFPGETIRVELWRDGDVVSFQGRVAARDVTAIANGRALLGAAS